MKRLLYISFFLISTFQLIGQNVSINESGLEPDSSAMLDITSNSKGVLVPRLTEVERNSIAGPASGLLIFQTTGTTGFWYNQGTAAIPDWVKLTTQFETQNILEDNDNDTKVSVENASDEDFIRFTTKGSESMTIDSFGNVSIGTYPTVSYHKFGVSGDKLGGLFRLNQEIDTLGAEISFLNQEVFKWSLGAADDAYVLGESFYLYNNDRDQMDLFIDGDSGYVGLGTTSPEGTLHLYGDGPLGAGSRLVFGDDYQSTTNQWNAFIGEAGWDSNIDTDILQLHARAGHQFTIGTMNGSPADTILNIFSNGRVMVGNEDLGQRFGINTNGSGHNLLRMRADSGQIGLWFTNDSSNWAMFSDLAGGSALPQGSFGIYGGKVGEPNAVRMVINKDGKLGVGTTTPDSLLDVSGGVRVSRLNINSAFTLPTIDGSDGQVLQTDGAGNLSWEDKEAYLSGGTNQSPSAGFVLSASDAGKLFATEDSQRPNFPENLPDGFHCVIVNFSNFTWTSNTLSTAEFFSASNGWNTASGASSFKISSGGTAHIYVTTSDGQKAYWVSGDISH